MFAAILVKPLYKTGCQVVSNFFVFLWNTLEYSFTSKKTIKIKDEKGSQMLNSVNPLFIGRGRNQTIVIFSLIYNTYIYDLNPWHKIWAKRFNILKL